MAKRYRASIDSTSALSVAFDSLLSQEVY